MSQKEKAEAFAALHVKGDPVELFNIWDAGSAKAVAKSGARAIATGSWSVAAAQGFADGEAFPIARVFQTASDIANAVDLPVTIDFEGAYAVEPDQVASNVSALIDTGAVGCNFEDQVVGGDGLHDVNTQVARIKAARGAAAAKDIPFFINARTDLFLKEQDRANHAGLLDAAIERANAYAEAGASGFFAPALYDLDLMAKLADAISLPLNVMWLPDIPDLSALGKVGLSRLSHGPWPYRAAMKTLGEVAPYP